MTPPAPASSIRFGRITLLHAQRRVLLDGRPARLGGRAFDLLQALIARRGELVPKRDLLKLVWPGVVVEENNLQVQVCTLRKLLGPHAIVTVPGRGYGFDAGIDVQPFEGLVQAGALPDRQGTELAPMRGRDAESAALAHLVRAHRLVTVTGPGGVGKSRLVRETLDATHPRIARVELERAPRERTVAECVADALGVAFVRAPASTEVACALASDGAPVVLENAEHSVGPIRELVANLMAIPGIHVVCTSQVPLRAPGENVLRLAPLPVPEGDGEEGAQHAASVLLLADAIAALRPGTVLSAAERNDAAAICRHLDGLPLAIELAAVRVPLIGLAGVRRRLADRFRLLTAGLAGTAQRQQSLLAAMQWSWGFLSGRERDALSAMARYHSRFTLGMARHALRSVAGNEWDAMELLGALADKSMVIVEPGSRTSYRLLESTRLFAGLEPRGAALRALASG